MASRRPWLLGILLVIWTSALTQTEMDNHIVVQGHRGCRGLQPENTVPAFIHALELGVSTLEMDVVLTADHHVLVSHEPWMNPDICVNPDGSKIHRLGSKKLNIYTMSLAEAQSFKLGEKPHQKYPNQSQVSSHKPTLSEVVGAVRQWCGEHQKALPDFNIEIKSMPVGDGIYHPAPTEYVRQFIAEFKDLNIADLSTIQSFDPRILRELFLLDPDLKLIYLIDKKHDLPHNFESHFDFRVFGISPDKQLVNREVVEYCKEEGYLLSVWTVNDEGEMQALIDLGLRNIISDYPDLLIEVAERNGLVVSH